MANTLTVPKGYEALHTTYWAIGNASRQFELQLVQDTPEELDGIVQIVAGIAALNLITNDKRVVPDSVAFGRSIDLTPRSFSTEEIVKANQRLAIMRNIAKAGIGVGISEDDKPLVEKYDDYDWCDQPRPLKEWTFSIVELMKKINSYVSRSALKGFINPDDIEVTTAMVMTGLDVDSPIMEATQGFSEVDFKKIPSGKLVVEDSPLTLIAAGVASDVYNAKVVDRLATLGLG